MPLFVVACLLLGQLAVPVRAQSDLDVTGTWKTTVTAKDRTKFRNILVISEQDGAGHVSGNWDIHGKGATARMEGSISGSSMDMRSSKASGGYRYTGTVRDRGGVLVWSGKWVGPIASWTGTFSAKLSKALIDVSDAGGTRLSATMVICNRDMTANTDDAVLECTAQVTDASSLPDSRAPTGMVAWTTDVGTIAPDACTLHTGGGSTAWCAVALRARPGEIPIGTAPPVTAQYPGDERFGPSEGSPQLYGAANSYDESDQYGPGCNPASGPYPSFSCGDPVNPATGNLSIGAVDMAVGGRGPGMAVDRTYNAQAAVAGQTGRFGAGWSDAYGAHIETGPKKQVTLVLGTGATVPFTAKGKRFTAPGWVTATLARRKDKGYLVTFQDRRTLSFDRNGGLTTISDRADEPISLVHLADGTLASVTDASGRMITFMSDAVGHVISATDPVGRTVSYAYDAAGDLVEVTDVLGGVARYAYDDQHRLTSTTDAAGALTANRYDAQSRITEQTDPLGDTMLLTYAGTYPDLVTVVTDGNGDRSAWEFREGVPVAETRGLGSDAPSTTSYVYDDRLALVTTVDPNGNLWRNTRDTAGNILSSTDPLGRMTTATYDKDNDPLSVVSPMGVTTRVTYDDLGLPVSVIDAVGTPDAATVTIAHDDPEHPADVTSITDPLGAVTTFSYDHHGDVISRTDALGNVSVVSRDELGWLRSMTDALGATTTITPDRQGRPVVLADPLGGSTSLARDAMGRPTSTTDTLGNTVTLANDATGRITEVALPDGTVLATGYDAIGASVSQTDGDGASWLLPRDDHGRQVGWVDPLGNAWQIAYDAADRLTRSTDPLGNVTSYQWDAADQLLAIDYPDDTPDVTFTHDLDGRRASMTDGTGTTGYSWDALGRLRSVTDGSGRTVDASYDARGFLRSITYPDGQIVEQDHDALGRLTAVRDGLGHASTFKWDAAGRLVRTVQGDGSVTTQSRDARGDVTAITTAADGGVQILDLEYARDALGHVAGITYPLADSTTPVTRDTRGRLTAVGPDTFGLDRDGALTRLRTGSLTYDAAGRLMSADGPDGLTTFTNDAAGRRVSATPADGEPMAYGWDAAGRLTDAGGTQYAYDGDGLRTSVVDEDGSAAAFTWLRADGRPRLLADGSSSWVYGPGGLPLEEIRADGSVRWLHADQGGSIRAVTDQTGAVVATADWDAYGEITRSTGESIGRLGFQGNYTDAHTGLQYLQARYYDPVTGAYLSVDPRVRSTRQPYAFAAGDPLTYGDPAGTDPLVMPGASVPSAHGTWPAPGRETFAGASVAGAAAEGGRYGGVQVEARPEAGIGPGSDSTHADSGKLDLGTCLGLGGKIQVDVGVSATTITASDAIAAAAAAVASDIVGASSMLVGP